MEIKNEKKVWVAPIFTEECLVNTNDKVPNVVETGIFST